MNSEPSDKSIVFNPPADYKPAASMVIAADILRSHPDIASNEELLKDILSGLRKAILDERKACAAEAEKYYNFDTANRPEYDDIEVAVKFTMKAISANIVSDIEGRDGQ